MLVVIFCVLGTVFFSGYIVWFENSVGQWIYFVVWEHCWSVVICCGS
jgi:hypothetical protein